MNHLKKSMVVIVSLIILNGYAIGQSELPNSGMGLSASYQNNQLDVLIPIWFSDSFVLSPSLGVVYVAGNETVIQFSLSPKFYLQKKKVSPFISLRTGVLASLPEDSDSVFDWIVGIAGGGEYFIDQYFSIGIEAQINASISDNNSAKFGNPGGTNINTATAIFATVYF